MLAVFIVHGYFLQLLTDHCLVFINEIIHSLGFIFFNENIMQLGFPFPHTLLFCLVIIPSFIYYACSTHPDIPLIFFLIDYLPCFACLHFMPSFGMQLIFFAYFLNLACILSENSFWLSCAILFTQHSSIFVSNNCISSIFIFLFSVI